MRKALARYSLRTKLVASSLLISMLVLGVVFVAFLVFQSLFLLRLDIARLRGLADVLVANIAAPTLFADSDAASEVLSSLRAEPAVLSATIVGLQTETISQYLTSAAPESATYRALVERGVPMLRTVVELPIVHQRQPLGTLTLVATRAPMCQQLFDYFVVMVLAFAFAATLAYRLAISLQQIISQPILALAKTSREVSQTGNYSLRAFKESHDEIGVLVDNFNVMIREVQLRDAELKRAHDELEERVRLRTIELERAKVAAEEASRMKSRFLANMSHELRTPMNGVLASADLMLDNDLPEEHRDMLLMIRDSGRLLLNIVNDVLDFSKIEAGKLQLAPEAFIVLDLMQSLKRAFEVSCAQAGNHFHIHVSDDVPRRLIGDETRVRQILMNLIGNAVKFTRNGAVYLILRGAVTPVGSYRIECSVVDTGPGIPPEKQRMIFDAFTQADSSVTRQFGGTGLGLSIVSQLVRLMNGSVRVESPIPAGCKQELNLTDATTVGSAFSVSIELGVDTRIDLVDAEKPATIPVPSGAHIAPASNTSILVVEDNLTNQKIIKAILSKAGYECDLADNGKEAVELLDGYLSHGQESRWQLILMDMQMPVLDGISATHIIRERELLSAESSAKKRHLPIIALTAHALDQERQSCFESGMDEFITKPISRTELFSKIEAVLQRTR